MMNMTKGNKWKYWHFGFHSIVTMSIISNIDLYGKKLFKIKVIQNNYNWKTKYKNKCV